MLTQHHKKKGTGHNFFCIHYPLYENLFKILKHETSNLFDHILDSMNDSEETTILCRSYCDLLFSSDKVF